MQGYATRYDAALAANGILETNGERMSSIPVKFDTVSNSVCDGSLILAPSVVRIMEGKALGTAKHDDLMLVKQLTKAVSDYKLPEFAAARKQGQTVGRRKLKEVQVRTTEIIMGEIVRYQAGKVSENYFRKNIVRAMKSAWRDVFLAGVRAGGYPGKGAGKKGKSLVELTPKDEKWLKSAMTHEMRFLNGFMESIIDETYKMSLERRTDMYVRALTSFYESARVIALPANVAIRWMGPGDKLTCPSCRYMFDNNPYTKENLPTTPRSGLTICLTNCRDRLLIRIVEPQEALDIAEASRYTRDGHIRNLRKIKRLGTL